MGVVGKEEAADAVMPYGKTAVVNKNNSAVKTASLFFIFLTLKRLNKRAPAERRPKNR